MRATEGVPRLKRLRQAALNGRKKPFLAITPLADREYLPEGCEISYESALAQVQTCIDALRLAGYGLGHRIGVLLENRPYHFILQLAFNGLGISIVPLNPDLRGQELLFILEHSGLDLVIAIDQRIANLKKLPFTGNKVPYGRLATAEEIAWPIAFLCSPGASFMCGAVIDVNGGLAFS